MSVTMLPLVARAVFGGPPWFAMRSATGGIAWSSTVELLDPTFTWAHDVDDATDHVTLTLPAVAELIWCSSLQPHDEPTRDQLVAALVHQLDVCHCELGACYERVGAAAAEHPAEYLTRMTWARDMAANMLNPFGEEA